MSPMLFWQVLTFLSVLQAKEWWIRGISGAATKMTGSQVYCWVIYKYEHDPALYAEFTYPYFIGSLGGTLDQICFQLGYIFISGLIMFSIVLATLIITFSYFLAKQHRYDQKVSTYECGFEPFNDTLGSFNLKFFLIAILFVLFDLEVVFLMPWSSSLSALDFTGVWSMFEFFIELGLSLFFIWYLQVLEF